MKDFISSKTNPKVKAAATLSRKPTSEAFVIEGFHLVQMAYALGALKEVYAVEDPKLDGVLTHIVTQEIIEKIATSKTPEPILGIASPIEKKGDVTRILALDRVQDPGNVGTLMRTALSFGFDEVAFLPGTCSPYNAKAIASSQGAIFGVKASFPASEKVALKSWKENGYFVIGSALKGALPMEGYQKPQDKIVLIMGNEGRGMSNYLLENADVLLRISMSGIDSLNVGVAGGILMHSLSLGTR